MCMYMYKYVLILIRIILMHTDMHTHICAHMYCIIIALPPPVGPVHDLRIFLTTTFVC